MVITSIIDTYGITCVTHQVVGIASGSAMPHHDMPRTCVTYHRCTCRHAAAPPHPPAQRLAALHRSCARATAPRRCTRLASHGEWIHSTMSPIMIHAHNNKSRCIFLTDDGNGFVQDDGNFKWEDVVPSYMHSTRTQDCDDFEAALREAEQRSRGEAVTSCEAAVWERMRCV